MGGFGVFWIGFLSFIFSLSYIVLSKAVNGFNDHMDTQFAAGAHSSQYYTYYNTAVGIWHFLIPIFLIGVFAWAIIRANQRKAETGGA